MGDSAFLNWLPLCKRLSSVPFTLGIPPVQATAATYSIHPIFPLRVNSQQRISIGEGYCFLSFQSASPPVYLWYFFKIG